MREVTVLVGLYERCLSCGQILFMAFVPGTPKNLETLGPCGTCNKWFRAQYEWADQSEIQRSSLERVKEAIDALLELNREVRASLVLLDLQETSAPQPDTEAQA